MGPSIWQRLTLMKDITSSSSRNITTFSTHLGLARYERFNFGCKSATEIFHETIRKRLHGVNGALNIHDDILIFDKNKEEHHKALKQVLEILRCCVLTANNSKCEIFKNSIKFYGLVFSDKGVTPGSFRQGSCAKKRDDSL